MASSSNINIDYKIDKKLNFIVKKAHIPLHLLLIEYKQKLSIRNTSDKFKNVRNKIFRITNDDILKIKNIADIIQKIKSDESRQKVINIIIEIVNYFQNRNSNERNDFIIRCNKIYNEGRKEQLKELIELSKIELSNALTPSNPKMTTPQSNNNSSNPKMTTPQNNNNSSNPKMTTPQNNNNSSNKGCIGQRCIISKSTKKLIKK
jgi:hypothetical protein